MEMGKKSIYACTICAPSIPLSLIQFLSSFISQRSTAGDYMGKWWAELQRTDGRKGRSGLGSLWDCKQKAMTIDNLVVQRLIPDPCVKTKVLTMSFHFL